MSAKKFRIDAFIIFGLDQFPLNLSNVTQSETHGIIFSFVTDNHVFHCLWVKFIYRPWPYTVFISIYFNSLIYIFHYQPYLKYVIKSPLLI